MSASRTWLPLIGAALLLPLAACGAPAGEEQEEQEREGGGEEEGDEGED